MNQKNLEQTTEEMCLRVIENVLKQNIGQAIDQRKKSKEPESLYEKVKTERLSRVQKYKTHILYSGLIAGLAAAATAGLIIYQFYAN